MRSPDGSVTALSSASATVFSIGIVFLGYWGVHEASPWRLSDVLIAVFALIGFACLGFVPFVVTRPVEEVRSDRHIRTARIMFAAGVGAIWLAVALSIVF
jgi:hypothetical protein